MAKEVWEEEKEVRRKKMANCMGVIHKGETGEERKVLRVFKNDLQRNW